MRWRWVTNLERIEIFFISMCMNEFFPEFISRKLLFCLTGELISFTQHGLFCARSILKFKG